MAARRAEGLVAAGGRVTVVAPQTVAAIDDDRSLEVERRPYRAGEAAGYDLVVTATGVPAVDGAVVADARRAGVLVDSADRTCPGTIRLPAVLRDGPVTVAVSTGWRQPGPGPVDPRPDRRRRSPPGSTPWPTLLDEARREMQAAGRPTDSVDWSTLLDDRSSPWSRPAGSTRPGPRLAGLDRAAGAARR